jgi:hypothetical protein
LKTLGDLSDEEVKELLLELTAAREKAEAAQSSGT